MDRLTTASIRTIQCDATQLCLAAVETAAECECNVFDLEPLTGRLSVLDRNVASGNTRRMRLRRKCGKRRGQPASARTPMKHVFPGAGMLAPVRDLYIGRVSPRSYDLYINRTGLPKVLTTCSSVPTITVSSVPQPLSLRPSLSLRRAAVEPVRRPPT